MSDYKMVPKVATEDMVAAGYSSLDDKWREGVDNSDAIDCYAAMLAAAPPFVVTDGLVDKVARALHKADRGGDWMKLNGYERDDYMDMARAAIEAVLGGGV